MCRAVCQQQAVAGAIGVGKFDCFNLNCHIGAISSVECNLRQFNYAILFCLVRAGAVTSAKEYMPVQPGQLCQHKGGNDSITMTKKMPVQQWQLGLHNDGKDASTTRGLAQ